MFDDEGRIKGTANRVMYGLLALAVLLTPALAMPVPSWTWNDTISPSYWYADGAGTINRNIHKSPDATHDFMNDTDTPTANHTGYSARIMAGSQGWNNKTAACLENYTLAFWVKINASWTTNEINNVLLGALNGNASGGGSSYERIFFDTAGENTNYNYVSWRDEGGTLTSAAPISNNRWNLLIFQHNYGGSAKVFMMNATNRTPTMIINASTLGTAGCELGSDERSWFNHWTPAATSEFKGKIYGFRFYRGKPGLTTAEMRTLLLGNFTAAAPPASSNRIIIYRPNATSSEIPQGGQYKFKIIGNKTSYKVNITLNGTLISTNYNATNGTAITGYLPMLAANATSSFNISMKKPSALKNGSNFVPKYRVYRFRYWTPGSGVVSAFTLNASGETKTAALYYVYMNNTRNYSRNFTATFYKTGYRYYNASVQATPTSGGLVNGTAEESGLNFTSRREITPYTRLGGYNLTFSNGTTTTDLAAQTDANPFFEYYEMPYYDVSLIVKDVKNTDSVEYEPRTYYFYLTPYSYYNFTAYLLTTAEGIYNSFYVMTYSEMPIEDARITIYETIGGEQKAVAQGDTDTAGKVSIFLNPYTTYYIKVEADGYVSYTFYGTPDPVEKQFIIHLYTTGTTGAQSINYSYIAGGISYQILPAASEQRIPFSISYEISSSKSDLEDFGYYLYVLNSSRQYELNYSDHDDSQPSGTTLTTPEITAYGKYRIVPWFKRADYDAVNLSGMEYNYYNRTGLAQYAGTGGISPTSWILLSIVAAVMVMGFIAQYSGVGAGLAGLMVLGFMFYSNPITIGSWEVWAIWLTTASIYFAWLIKGGGTYG